jgi:hypothetical protein
MTFQAKDIGINPNLCPTPEGAAYNPANNRNWGSTQNFADKIYPLINLVTGGNTALTDPSLAALGITNLSQLTDNQWQQIALYLLSLLVNVRGFPPSSLIFHNNSGETAPAYGVLKIQDTSLVMDANGNVTTVYEIGKPSAVFDRIYLVNATQDIAAHGYGYCSYLSESNYVLYDASGVPAVGEAWGPANGQWSLKKWRYGFTIEGGRRTTPNRVVAKQEFVNLVRGKTYTATTKGATDGIVDLYDGNSVAFNAGIEQLTGVVDDFVNIGSNKIVYVSWIGGKWADTGVECPPT